METTTGQHRISLWTATALVVANMVGTGVFTSLGFQVATIPTAFPVLLLWTIGGIVALCGALCYGELAAALPRSGGEYHFLSRIFHPALGFMSGWLSVTMGFAAPTALAAMAFGTYLHGVFPGVPALPISLALVWVASAVHLTSVRGGSRFQNGFTGLKLGLVLALIVAGFLVSAAPQAVAFRPVPGDFERVFSAPFAVSLVFVMYAYSGWNAATYIVHEIHDPRRNVPRALRPRHRSGGGALHRGERRVSPHHAGGEDGRPAGGRADRGAGDFRPARAAGSWACSSARD